MEDIAALAAKLAALHTAQDILTFRRRLDAATAQAVIRALSPIDRAAVLLCVQFASQDRWAPFNSAIIDGLDAEAIWLSSSEQPIAQPLPSGHNCESIDGQLTSRNQRRVATRRAR